MDDSVGKYIVFKFNKPTKPDRPSPVKYQGLSGPVKKFADRLEQNRAKEFKNSITSSSPINVTAAENARFIESGTFAGDHKGEQLSAALPLYSMGADPYLVLGEVEKFGRKVSPDVREGVMGSVYNTLDGLENYAAGDERLSDSLRKINQEPDVTLTYVEAETYTPQSNEIAFSYTPDTGLRQVYDMARPLADKPIEKLKGKAKKKALKLLNKGSKKLGKKIVGKAGKKAVKRVGKKAAKFATKQGIQHLGGLIGSAIPGAGTAAGEFIGRIIAELLFIIGKLIKKFAKYIAAAGLALVGLGVLMASPFMIVGGGIMIASGAVVGGTVAITAGIATLQAILPILFTTIIAGIIPTMLIALIATPLIIAFIIFIITTGAYVVPGPGEISEGAAGTIPGPINPGTIAAGSCPLTGQYIISTPSYNSQTESGHGSNSYWGNVCGNYSIPIQSMVSDCYGPSYSTPLNNVCESDPRGTCPYYGYAVDVQPVPSNNRDAAVYIPFVCDPGVACPGVTWTSVTGWFNCAGQSTNTRDECGGEKWGYGVVFTATGNNSSWRIHLGHIDPVASLLNTDGTIKTGVTFQSGDQIGESTEDFVDLFGNTHIHIELNKNGFPIKPDFLCNGDSGDLILPEGVTKFSIGKSVLGNNITAYEVVNPSSTSTDRALVVVSGIHTTGGINGNNEGDSTYHIGQEVFRYFTNNPENVPANISLTIIPTLNVDVLDYEAYTTELCSVSNPNRDQFCGGPLSDRVGRTNARGVDLNRNWNYRHSVNTQINIGTCIGCGGPSPFSEPETRSLNNYLNSINVPYGLVSLHSLLPGGAVILDSESEVTTNDVFTNTIATGMGYSTFKFTAYTVFGDLMGYIALDNEENWACELGDPAIPGDSNCTFCSDTVAADIEFAQYNYDGAALTTISNQTISGIQSAFGFVNNLNAVCK